MGEYNYLSFPLDADMDDFVRFPTAVRVGEAAPTGTLIDAANETPAELGDIFREGTTVIEFGSLT